MKEYVAPGYGGAGLKGGGQRTFMDGAAVGGGFHCIYMNKDVNFPSFSIANQAQLACEQGPSLYPCIVIFIDTFTLMLG